MSTEDMRTELGVRLAQNYADYEAGLLTCERQALINRATEIADVQKTYEALITQHEFTADELAHFLQFQNPLEVISDHWPEAITCHSEDLTKYPLITDGPAPESLRKFMNVDIIASLQAIMGQVTVYYQDDFEYNRKTILKAAQAGNPEQLNFLWLCRTNGTYLHQERDVFIKGTASYNNVQFYHHDCQSEQVVLYSVEITGIKNGVVRGNLYECDRRQYAELAGRSASPYTDVSITCLDGHMEQMPHEQYNSDVVRNLTNYHGKILEVRHEAEDESVVQGALRREHERRENLPKGRINAHVEKLADQRIQAEADRIQSAFAALKEPNSPNKTHFMAAISQEFLLHAGTRETDSLFDKLHKSLKNDTMHFSSLKGEKGQFCFIKADPVRTAERPERKPSIKEQLTAPPTQETKPATKSKEKEAR